MLLLVNSWFFGNSIECFWSFKYECSDSLLPTQIMSLVSRNTFKWSNLLSDGNSFPSARHFSSDGKSVFLIKLTIQIIAQWSFFYVQSEILHAHGPLLLRNQRIYAQTWISLVNEYIFTMNSCNGTTFVLPFGSNFPFLLLETI